VYRLPPNSQTPEVYLLAAWCLAVVSPIQWNSSRKSKNRYEQLKLIAIHSEDRGGENEEKFLKIQSMLTTGWRTQRKALLPHTMCFLLQHTPFLARSFSSLLAKKEEEKKTQL